MSTRPLDTHALKPHWTNWTTIASSSALKQTPFQLSHSLLERVPHDRNSSKSSVKLSKGISLIPKAAPHMHQQKAPDRTRSSSKMPSNLSKPKRPKPIYSAKMGPSTEVYTLLFLCKLKNPLHVHTFKQAFWTKPRASFKPMASARILACIICQHA